MKKEFMFFFASVLMFFSLNADLIFGQSFPWTNFKDRAVLEVSKNNLLPTQNLQYSPQKVEVNATGNFNFSLPVMVVPGRGGLNFDLTLTYTPGIKATDEASWVGLGWDMDIGKIVRIVNNFMDNTIQNKDYYDELFGTSVDDYNRDIYMVSTPFINGKMLQLDPYPDNPTSQYVFQLEEWKPWKIQYISHGFIIISEDGTKYVFNYGAPGGASNHGISGNCQLFFAHDEPFMQWYLTAILSHDYSDGGGDANDPTDAGASNNKGNWIKIFWSSFDRYFYDKNKELVMAPPPCGIPPQISYTSIAYPTHIVTPTHVAKFEIENETSNPVCAIFAASWPGIIMNNRPQDSHFRNPFSTPAVKKRLKSIKLYRRDAANGVPPADLGTAKQEVTFNYNYAWSGYQEQRTTLNTVVIKAGSVTLNPYAFTYFSGPDKAWKTDYPGITPYYYGPMFDPDNNRIGFLGWYTEALGGGQLNNPSYIYGMKDHGRLWNLQKVTYPTGSSIEFDYEYNRYYVDFSYMGTADMEHPTLGKAWGLGPRLIKQKLNSGTSVTEYQYTYISALEDGTVKEGLGRLYCDPVEYEVSYWTGGQFLNYNDPIRMKRFHQTRHPVLYEQILEKKGATSGSTFQVFSQIKSYYAVARLDENIAPSGTVTPQLIFNNTMPRRGYLTKREYLNTSNSAVMTEEFSRTEAMLNDTWANGPRFSYWKSSDTKTTTKDGVRSVVSTGYSPENGLPNKTTETNSDGKQRINRIKYPKDYAYGSGIMEPMAGALNSMKGRNMLTVPIEKTTAELGTDGIEYLAAASLTKFLLASGNVIRQAEDLVFVNSGKIPFSSFTQSYVSGTAFIIDSRYKTKQLYDQYDSYNNLLQATDPNGNKTKYIYGHNKSVLIADFRNTGTGNVNADNFNDGNITDADPFTWTTTGTWSASTGALKSTNTAYAGNHSVQYQNFTADVTLRIISNYGNQYNWAAIHFGSTSSDVFNTGYMVFYRSNGEINLYSLGTSLKSVQTNLPPSTARQLSVTVNGTNVQVFVDGEQFINYTLSAAATSGYISLYAYVTDTEFDEFRTYPAGALAHSYAYDPTILLINRLSDENGNSLYADYDGIGRPTYIYGPGKTTLELSSYSSDLKTISTTIYSTPSPQGFKQKKTDAFGKPVSEAVQYEGGYISAEQTYDNAERLKSKGRPYSTSSLPSGGSLHTYDTEYKYYDDPLDRIKEQGVYGSSVWQTGGSHSLKFYYESNEDYDVFDYGEKTLYKLTFRDENGTEKIEYKDIFGKVIQGVTAAGDLDYTNRFRYDILGNLTNVIAPNGLISTYANNTIGQLTQKTSPDAGTVQYLYDKNGNLRFIKDANHTGSYNNISRSGSVTYPNNTSGSFTMNMPGKLTISITFNSAGGAYAGINLKANGVLLATVSVGYGSTSASRSFVLPKGNYTYESSFAGAGSLTFSITCNNKYEFVYHKYDNLNRIIETGEYLSTNSTNSFLPVNAENKDFPATSDRLIHHVLVYDNPVADGDGQGQRNLKGKLSSATSYRLGENPSATYYSYNNYGMVEWVVQKLIYMSGAKKISYDYDLRGNIIRKSYEDFGSSARNHFWWYEYDKAGRLWKVYSGPDDAGKVKEVEYTYLPNGKVKRQQLGQAQGVDYVYNERDWLTQINHQNLGGIYQGQPQDPGRDGFDSGLPVDKFGMIIGYNVPGHIGDPVFQNAAPQYNGNISWLIYNMSGVNYTGSNGTTPIVGWTYDYDKINRLKSANFGYYAADLWRATTAYDEANYMYDKVGNITSMQRYGAGVSPALMDNLTYRYSYNQTPGTVNLNPDRDIAVDPQWKTVPQGLPVYEVLNDGNTPIDQDYVTRGTLDFEPRSFEIGFSKLPENTVIDPEGEIELTIRAYNPLECEVKVTLYSGDEEIGTDYIPYSNWANHKFYFWADEMYKNDLKVKITETIGLSYNSAISWMQIKVPVLNSTGSNRLSYIDDGVSSTLYTVDMDDQASGNYAYDGNGNVIKDTEQKIAFIQYDFTNRPLIIKKSDGGGAEYYYDTQGNLIKKYDGGTEFYILGADGKTEVITPSGATTPTYYIWGNDIAGQVKRSGSTLSRYYYLKDHIGSIRMTVDAAGTTVVSYNDYYPFGMTMEGRNMVNVDPRWGFTGKEKSSATGHYMFGARTYNPLIGRWDQVDPLSNMFFGWNSYNYCFNNPINLIDMSGLGPDDPPGFVKDDDYRFIAILQEIPITPEGSSTASTESIEGSSTNLDKGGRLIGATTPVVESAHEFNKFLKSSEEAAVRTHNKEKAIKQLTKIAQKYNGTIRVLGTLATGLTVVKIYIDFQQGNYTQATIDGIITAISYASFGAGIALTIYDAALSTEVNGKEVGGIERTFNFISNEMLNLYYDFMEIEYGTEINDR